MIPQQEVKILPGDFLPVVEACGLHHGLDAILRLALWQRAIWDLNERPAAEEKVNNRPEQEDVDFVYLKKKNLLK